MKIVVITGRGLKVFGGIETYAKEIYILLAEQGHGVIIYNHGGDASFSDSANRLQIRCLPCLSLPHCETLSHCLLSVIDSWFRKQDIICYHGFIAALVSWLPVRRGVKKVIVFHGLDWHNKLLNPFIRIAARASEKIGSQCADQLIVVSEYLRQYFWQRYRCAAICIQPGARPHTLRLPRRISEWGLKHENYILFLGRLTPEKGCHLLIQAFLRLKTGMKLVIAGPGIFAFQDHYRRYLKKISSSDSRIIFTGLVGEDVKEELLSNAYIVVYPALVGGLPLALLEAMAHRRCAVVSSVCDDYEVIRHCAVLFKSGDKDDLLRKLQGILGDGQVRRDYGCSGEHFVLSHFSWEASAARFGEVFKQITQNHNA